MHIRLATRADLPAINRIYNHYVLHSTATYQTQPSTEHERLSWFESHGPRHPILVAELEAADRLVVGWASLSPFHPRQAFAHTVEDSVYLDPAYCRQGLGRRFLTELVERARQIGHHSVVGVISADQTPSIALHQSQGFKLIGTLSQAGRKFDRWLDLAYLQLLLT